VVEDVESVCLHFEKRAFTKKRGQTEPLGETHVDREEPWTTKRIAPDARQQRSGRIVWIEVLQTAAGKVSAGPDERVVTRIVKRAAKIVRRPRRADEVLRARRAHALTGVRRPRKTGVPLQNTINLPAAERLGDEIVTAAKQRQIPQTR